MSWKRNNGAPLPNELYDSWNRATNTSRIAVSFYRSRNPLDESIVHHLNMLFTYPELVDAASKLNWTLKQYFNTYAAPRGNEDDLEEVIDRLTGFTGNRSNSNNIIIYNMSTNPELMDGIRNELTEEGWAEHDFNTALAGIPTDKVFVFSMLTRRITETYYNTTTVIFTNNLDDDFMVKLGAILPKIYTYALSSEALTQAFLSMDREAFYNSYFASIREYLSGKKERDMRNNLEELRASLGKGATQKLDDDVTTAAAYVRDTYSTYLRHLKALQDAQIKKASMYWNKQEDYINTFVDYLLTNDLSSIEYLRLGNNGTTLDVVLRTKLLYWDEAYYENYAKSKMQNCITKLQAKQRALADDIFINRTVVPLFITGVRVNLSNGAVEKNTGLYANYGAVTIGAPHTHTQYYDCFGNNRTPIAKAILDRDYIIMWEQVRSAMSGLNLSDTGVFVYFIEHCIQSGNYRFLELADTKEVLTANEFISRYPEGYKLHTTVIEPEAEPIIVEAPVKKRKGARPDVEPVDQVVAVAAEQPVERILF